jgi:putative redox protein
MVRRSIFRFQALESRVIVIDMASEMTIQLRQTSASATEAAIGRHRVAIDRPVAKGGGDTGPMGGELFLAAVGGCFMSTLLAAIKARKAEISDVRVEVVGSLADSPARFGALELRVSAGSRDPELLERLVGIADRGCIMMNTLRGALDVRVLIATAVQAQT